MRRNGIIGGGRVTLATMVATALTFGGIMSSAKADTVEADGDTVTAGLQTTRNLGTVAPGATTTADVSFQLQCATKKHVDDGQSVILTFNSSGSTTPVGGSLSASQANIGNVSGSDPGMPASWPEDGSDCPGSPLILSGSVSTVSVTAPTASGIYTYIAKYIVELNPAPGSDDSSSITGSAPSVTFTLTVAAPSDTTAPETTITAGPAPLVNIATATFAFTSSESGSTFACSLDGATEAPCTSPKTYTGLGDGSHTFNVRATDGAGNPDASAASSAWTVDTTAPNTSITAGPGPLVNTTGATFLFTSTEADSTFACSLDGTDEASCSSPVSYTGLAQGSHTFSVRAFDEAGNADSTAASSTWTVDSLAPETTITANPAAVANTTSAAFSFTSSEASSTFACSLDGGALAACSSPQSYTDLGQGSHTFAVNAVDAAGNADTSPASFYWTVDSIPPSVSTPDLVSASDSGLANDDNKTNDDTPTLAGVAEPGSTVELLRNGTVVASGTAAALTGAWEFTTAALADGTHSFVGRATDAAANVASSDALIVVVDKTAPGITYFSRTAPNAAGWNNTDVTVVWNCSDSTSGPTSLTVSTTVSAEAGGQSATGTCTDLAGNSASDTTGTDINIDKTAPTVAYTSASPAANGAGWNNTDVTATFTATDGLSGFTGASLTRTGTAVTSTEGIDVTVTSPAFTDLAGNTVAAGAATSAAYDIDKTAPGNIQFVGGPVAGGEYYFGTVPAAPGSCTADDALSLVSSCSISGYSNTVGTQTMRATAEDNAGNSDSVTRSYSVLGWTLKGFYQPVDMGGIVNLVKPGSTVPLKFEAFAGPTELTALTTVASFKVAQAHCGTTPGSGDDIEQYSTGSTTLRYDTTGGQFIQNWQVPKVPANTCFKLTLTLADSSSAAAYFRTK